MILAGANKPCNIRVNLAAKSALATLGEGTGARRVRHSLGKFKEKERGYAPGLIRQQMVLDIDKTVAYKPFLSMELKTIVGGD